MLTYFNPERLIETTSIDNFNKHKLNVNSIFLLQIII